MDFETYRTEVSNKIFEEMSPSILELTKADKNHIKDLITDEIFLEDFDCKNVNYYYDRNAPIIEAVVGLTTTVVGFLDVWMEIVGQVE